MTKNGRVVSELQAALQSAGVREVLVDSMTRAAYTTDASLYRVEPRAVVFPRGPDDLEAVLSVARSAAVPVTMRGAGTSVAGNAIGEGIVVDTSRYFARVLDVDVERRLARVEPGVVHATLQRAVQAHGLRFGPDPSTHTRCTIGGMIGNDACGARSLGYGKTSQNVETLRVLTASGDSLLLSRASGAAPSGVGDEGGITPALRGLADGALGQIRTEMGRFGRQISGYALQCLLPESGYDIAGSLVGSEGTLAVITEATVRLVEEPPHRILVVLGFDSFADAGDATMMVLEHKPTACEGLDSRIVSALRAHTAKVPPLPRGQAWLMVELAGDSRTEVAHRADLIVRSVDAVDARVVCDSAEASVLWKIREDGAGLSGRAPSGCPAWPGWEDAAVPPPELGSYLRGFDALLAEFGLSAMPFGHFGEGCVHARVDVDLSDDGGPQRLRAFVEAAAELVASHGGSLTGEHGDGRARSELLGTIYSDAILRLFAGVKQIWDPQNLLNPGVLVDPLPLDADLRRPAARESSARLAFAFGEDDGSLVDAVHRCTGVGKCRSVEQGAGVVMCPSYAATGDEVHSTRGRARMLQEMLNGHLVSDGWRSPEVHEALDLCLGCKGCVSDCPTGVDMATYKAEVLHQRYRRRLRPRSHYSLGWLPRWARMASVAPWLANAVASVPVIRRAAMWLGGVDPRRTAPRIAARSAQRWGPRSATSVEDDGDRRVLLFIDCFSRHFEPEAVAAAVEVLSAAGFEPQVTSRSVCCGLTWISTGQLRAAKRRLRRATRELVPLVDAGVPVIGLEPSCTATIRADLPALLSDSEASRVASMVSTLAEFLGRQDGWTPPDLSGVQIVAQPHCHHHAVLGWGADHRLLQRAGADVRVVGGCCGLAGNFGVERGHYETSVAVAGLQLLPALDAAPDAVYLADGFSCRTQVSDLRDRHGVHLATLLRNGSTADPDV